MGNSSQCLSESSLYCRENEYSSRPFEPSPDSTNGMILNISVIQKKTFKFQISGHPLMDMFASIHNRQTQIFCTWFPHHQTYALDALSDSWDRIVVYAYPPICHIPKVLQHMRRFNCPVIHFDNATLAQKTLVHITTPICNRNTKNTTKIQNLLKKPKTEIKHPNLETLLLTA